MHSTNSTEKYLIELMAQDMGWVLEKDGFSASMLNFEPGGYLGFVYVKEKQCFIHVLLFEKMYIVTRHHDSNGDDNDDEEEEKDDDVI